MVLSASLSRWLAVVTVLAVAVVLSACADDPVPLPTPTATPTPTPTATPTPTPTVTPTPEEANRVVSMIMTEIGLTSENLSEVEASCMLEGVADIDPDTFDADDPPPEVVAAMMACIPDVFIAMMVGEFGLTPEGLSREETSCLRGWVKELDPEDISASDPPPELIADMIACIPDVFISVMIAEGEYSLSDLTREELGCLRRWVANIDPAWFSVGEPPQEAAQDMISCAPRIFSNSAGGATSADQGDKFLRMGVMESLTGPGETYGNVALQAKQMAVDEINAAGGVNGRMLELVVEDSKCNAQDAITAYNKLTDVERVKIILGASCSGAMFGLLSWRRQME